MKTMNRQTGMAGILLSGLLSAALMLAGIEINSRANSASYDIQNKANAEEAAHIAEAAFTYMQRVVSDQDRFNDWVSSLNNQEGVVLGGCTPGKDTPVALKPSQQVTLDFEVPYDGRQSLIARAVVVPKDCSAPLDFNNHRVVIEMTGASHCEKRTAEERQETCVLRSITLNRDRGTVFKTKA